MKDDNLSETPNENDNNKKNNIKEIDDEFSYTYEIEAATSIKCSLLSVLNSNSKTRKKKMAIYIQGLIEDYNKISLDGIYLFNILIRTLIKKRLYSKINSVTIRRCFGILKEGDKYITLKDPPNPSEIDMIYEIIESYFKNNNYLRPEFNHDEEGFMKPLEACADGYLNNLILHIRTNFFRFQRKYLKSKIESEFENHKLSRSEINILTLVIQKKLVNLEYSPRTDKNIKKLQCLLGKIPNLNVFTDNEKKLLKEFIEDLELLETEEKMIKKISSDNIIRFLSYFSLMLEYLKSIEKERFSLIPIFQPKMRFFRFDPMTLCTLYNKWESINGYNPKLPAAYFKDNFDNYFDVMFNISDRFHKILNKFPTIKSIQTDGIAVVLTFEKRKEIKYLTDKDKREENRIKRETEQKKIKKEFLEKMKGLRTKISSLKKDIGEGKKIIGKYIYLEFDCICIKNQIIEMSEQIKNSDNDTVREKILRDLKKMSDKYQNIQKSLDDCDKDMFLKFKLELKRKQNNLDTLEKELESLRKKPEIIDLEKKLNPKRQDIGMYESTEVRCSPEFLKEYRLVGADPGNNPMVDMACEDGIHVTISKNEYFDLAQVFNNNNKINKLREEANMNDITTQLSKTTYRTASTEEFMEYVKVIKKNWNEIWDHYSDYKLSKIKLSSYRSSQKAISGMARRIIERLNDEKNINKYMKSKEMKLDKSILEKPIIIFFGKGNGSLTISNTKNTSSKGPIKRLIEALSKYVVVILTPEYNTSKMCHLCGEKLIDIETYNFPKRKSLERNMLKRMKDNKENKTAKEIEKSEIDDNIKKIKEIERLRGIIHKLKKIRKEKKNRVKIEEIEREIEGMKCGRRNCYQTSYKLRRCAKHHEENLCKLFERNLNAAINIRKKGIKIITTGICDEA
ncbi:MAG: hypothetical protein Hyperionvirus1_73 [Hyperionvirus sp.]|uniref:Uncharacterized protein n=1 Tax=Hyperionvirus sp. TaxID=2487770 RepID=A0A3G5A7K8_9VIRU|nr:MAG: hypothetical protein Hyperionvirus1_73 [Hyperionvirus sp.]